MKLREVISDEVVKASGGGAYDDLESGAVEAGTVLEVRHVAVENKTTAYTRLTVGVADGISFVEKEEQDSPGADDIFFTSSAFLIPAGKKLRARLTGCTAADAIRMAFEGMLYEVE